MYNDVGLYGSEINSFIFQWFSKELKNKILETLSSCRIYLLEKSIVHAAYMEGRVFDAYGLQKIVSVLSFFLFFFLFTFYSLNNKVFLNFKWDRIVKFCNTFLVTACTLTFLTTRTGEMNLISMCKTWP